MQLYNKLLNKLYKLFNKKTVNQITKLSTIEYIESNIKILNLKSNKFDNLELLDFQKNLIKTIENNQYIIIKKPRQVGFSTLIYSYLINLSLNKIEPQKILVYNNKNQNSFIINNILKIINNSGLQNEISISSDNYIIFKNGNSIKMIKNLSNKPFAETFTLLFWDEVAHDTDNNIFWNELKNSGNSTGKIILGSTPYYRDIFFENKYKSAVNKTNNLIPFEIKWHESPYKNLNNENFDRMTFINEIIGNFS